MPLAGAVAVLAAGCTDSDLTVVPVEVIWMEWPAEVLPATRFSVRLMGYGPGCYRTVELRVPVAMDQSAVTFEPYFLVDGTDPEILCDVPLGEPRAATPPIDAGYYDTRHQVDGLAADYPRTYEMRAAATVFAPYAPGASGDPLPVRTFGQVMVRSDAALTPPLNVGGNVYIYRDSLACARAVPTFLYPGYVVENPPIDTAATFGFVRGYLYTPPQPVCGETRVLRVVTWN